MSKQHPYSPVIRWRTKPVDVMAYRWWKNGDHPEDGPADREGKIVRYFRRPDVPGDTPCSECGKAMNVHGWIDTLEGGHRVCPGDWIITGVRGERYPCKPEIFSVTYEPASPDPKTAQRLADVEPFASLIAAVSRFDALLTERTIRAMSTAEVEAGADVQEALKRMRERGVISA